MKEVIKKIISEGWDLKLSYIPRNLISSELITSNVPLVLTGPRRAGKSYTMYEIREVLRKKGKDFVYINFEDERLLQFKTEDFDLILEAYYELREEKPVLFFDEIHNVNGWERYVRRLADNGYKVVITGSNSKMLSKEIAERLGGRFIEINIYPLSFKEFLKFKGVEFKEEYLYSKQRFKLKKYFDEYLEFGGFPEVSLFSGKMSKEKLLNTYFDLVFYKDLVSRERVENEEVLKLIIKKLRENIGKLITPRRIYSFLKESDMPISPNTVDRYINYLQESFLIISCLPFAKSVSKQIRKKRYFIDNGYVKLFEIKEDKGLMLENLIFTELIKKGKKVFYHLGQNECDFILGSNEAMQVTYELNKENEDREVKGLLEAMKTYKLKKGYIITNDQEKEIRVNNKKIIIMPAWKWILKN
ncbi:ATP-binding protein [Candidatus Micrarchaeota archaeon]|nr:ATP-binding protein [Candidatus Micrarchaeota archaeon]